MSEAFVMTRTPKPHAAMRLRMFRAVYADPY
jgi:hypothetical protein